MDPDQAPESYKKKHFLTRKERIYCPERETFEKESPPNEEQSTVTRPLYKLRFN